MTTTNRYPVGAPIPLLLAAAQVSGVPFMADQFLAIPVTSGAIGDTIACEVEGTHLLAKVTGTAWTIGQDLFWDVVNLKVTHTSNTAANPRIGTAMAAAASGDATGLVKLCFL